MAFELKITVCETCEGLNFVDTTGAYDIASNPTGYGGPDGPSAPGAFTSYIFSWFQAGTDPTAGPATYTLDVTGNTPTPDDDGDYTWSVSLDELGMSAVQSGTCYISAIATDGTGVYSADCEVEFYKQVERLFDDAMSKQGPLQDCGCKGCTDLFRMYSLYLCSICGGAYSGSQFQSNMDYFKAHLPTCC